MVAPDLAPAAQPAQALRAPQNTGRDGAHHDERLGARGLGGFGELHDGEEVELEIGVVLDGEQRRLDGRHDRVNVVGCEGPYHVVRVAQVAFDVHVAARALAAPKVDEAHTLVLAPRVDDVAPEHRGAAEEDSLRRGCGGALLVEGVARRRGRPAEWRAKRCVRRPTLPCRSSQLWSKWSMVAVALERARLAADSCAN